MGKAITVNSLSKSFAKDVRVHSLISVLENIDLEVGRGEFVTIFGPNGCGKTTFLNILAGLLFPNKGLAIVRGRNSDTGKIGLVSQNFSETLFPWLRNIDNIAFPLEIAGMPKAERHKSVIELERNLDIKIDNYSYPYQLSSGQQQLVAIARAIINQPDVLLMDEPFNALDFQTRIFMEDKILDIWEKTRVTILFVSHDIDEAIYLADRVVFFTKLPARILKTIEVRLPRPRSQQMLASKEFFELRSEAIEIFGRAMSK